MTTATESFREWISVGDHDGHHPFACDACQVIDLAVEAFPRFAVGYVQEALTAEVERVEVHGP